MKKRQKWEGKAVMVHDDEDIISQVNKLGEDGWEWVETIYLSGGNHVLHFKRQKLEITKPLQPSPGDEIEQTRRQIG